MNLWTDANDFSELAKPIPCPLCGKSASSTVTGNHFKCSEESHLFNQDGSPLPEGVKCYCDNCFKKQKPEGLTGKIIDTLKGKRKPKRKKTK